MKRLLFLRRLVSHLFRHTPLWYASLVLSLVSVLAEVAAVASLYPLTLLATNSAVNPGFLLARVLAILGAEPNFRGFLLLFLGFLFFRIATSFLNQALYHRLGRRTHAMLSSQAFEAIVKHETVRAIEEKSAGHFITLAGDESFRTSTIIVSLIQLVNYSSLAVLYFLAILRFSPGVAGALVVFLFLSGILLAGIVRRSRDLGALQIAQSAEAGSLFLDSLNGLRSIRAFSAEAYVTDNYRRKLYEYTHTLFLTDLYPQLYRTVPAALLISLCMIAALLAPEKVWASIDIAYVMTLVAFVMRFLPTLGSAISTLQRLLYDAKAGKDLTEIVQRREGVAPAVGTLDAPVEEIRIENLRFAYREGIDVLRGLSQKFRRGQSYAIVGASGAGKSTLLDLMLKFYPTPGGSIFVNGMELGTLSNQSLRQRAVLLAQSSPILNDTVFHNIKYGGAYSTAEVLAACKVACVDDVIASLPQGLHTVLQYQGSNLSGGQRQRISLARALLRRPDVLILDECTSALDEGTRERVVKNILREYAHKIVIFVTHDPFVQRAVSDVIRLEKPSV